MMKEISRCFFAFLWISVLFLNVGAIRKNEDPIAKAQTDPISYNQKMEEIKDGVKGAPTPSFKYYEKEDFLVKAPTQTAAEQKPEKEQSLEAGPAEVLEEEFDEEFEAFQDEELPAALDNASESSEEEAEGGDDWWVEDVSEEESEGLG